MRQDRLIKKKRPERWGVPDEMAHADVTQRGEHAEERDEVYRRCTALAPEGGCWAEFGVKAGVSAQALMRLLPVDTELHLFDSWQGLPEDWDVGYKVVPKGRMACTPVHRAKNALGDEIRADARIHCHEGWFKDTVEPWSRRRQDEGGSPLSLVHIDCDLYSSTREVLRAMNQHIKPGTVLIFDDMLGYEYYRDGEWRAYREWCAEFGREVEWIVRTNRSQVAGRVVT